MNNGKDDIYEMYAGNEDVTGRSSEIGEIYSPGNDTDIYGTTNTGQHINNGEIHDNAGYSQEPPEEIYANPTIKSNKTALKSVTFVNQSGPSAGKSTHPNIKILKGSQPVKAVRSVLPAVPSSSTGKELISHQIKINKPLLKTIHKDLLKWLGIITIIGAALVFIFQVVIIFLNCSLNFYVGIWVCFILLASGLFQLRLFFHFKEVGQGYIIATIVSIFISGLTMVIGFILILIELSNNTTNQLCTNTRVLLLFSVCVDCVVVGSSIVAICSNLCRKNREH